MNKESMVVSTQENEPKKYQVDIVMKDVSEELLTHVKKILEDKKDIVTYKVKKQK